MAMKDSLDFTEISILYLCSRKIFLHKIDRVRFHAVQAISKLCHVVWSGPGWENWDDAKSLKENVAILYKDKKRPDLIFCYQPFLIKGFSEIDIPTCHSYNEMGTVEQPRSYTVKEIVENKIEPRTPYVESAETIFLANLFLANEIRPSIKSFQSVVRINRSLLKRLKV